MVGLLDVARYHRHLSVDVLAFHKNWQRKWERYGVELLALGRQKPGVFFCFFQHFFGYLRFNFNRSLHQNWQYESCGHQTQEPNVFEACWCCRCSSSSCRCCSIHLSTYIAGFWMFIFSDWWTPDLIYVCIFGFLRHVNSFVRLRDFA